MKLKYRNKIMFTILFFLIVFIGIGYGAISLSLKTEADAVVEANTWDLTKEIIYKDGNVSSSEVEVNEDTFSFSTTLTDEYDYYNYIVKVENKGTIDATLEELTLSSLTEDQEELINYTATYTDGTAITLGDIIPAGETAKLLVRVEYKEGLDTYTSVTLDNLTLTINYKIATEEAQNELPTTHTVNFYVLTEDGTYTKTSKLLSIGSILDTIAPTLTGHDFMGWSNEPDGEVLYEPGSTYNDNYAIELYTIFELTKYDISFDLNDGAGTFETIVKTHSVDLTLPEEEPTKTGYTFAGWSTNNADIEYQAGDTLSLDEDTTLYAMWTANTYTVVYNGNGSTSGSTASSTHTYDTAKTLTANGFAKTGYTFSGWATSASGSKVYSDKQSVSNLTTTSGGTVNLYAVWTANTYTVVYNGNDSTSGSTASSTHTYDTSKPLTANGFAKTGYTFSGWATSASGSKVYSDKQSVSNLTATAGGTFNLYAVWSINSYTLTINPNGGTWNSSTSTQTATQNYGTTKTIANPTRTGYTFGGWTTSGTCNLSGTTFTYGAGACTLTAKWTGISYSVKYNGNGSTSGSMSNSSHVYGTAKALTANVFSRTGYSFSGWATSASGSKVYSDKQSVSNLTTTSGGTVNLYAVWTINSYTLTFNANGGSVSTTSIKQNYGTSLTLPTPTRSGYNFLGWYTATSGGTKRTYTTMPAVSETLYAQWEVKTIAFTKGSSAGGGGGNQSGGGGASQAILPSGVTVYYTLNVSAYGTLAGTTTAYIKYDDVEIDSLTIDTATSETKSGSFTTTTSATLYFGGSGQGGTNSGGTGGCTITKIVDENGNEYVLK